MAVDVDVDAGAAPLVFTSRIARLPIAATVIERSPTPVVTALEVDADWGV